MAGPLGSTPGIIVGVGVGAAAAAALEPAIEIPKQEAWATNANKILTAGLLARLVAMGGIDLSVAHGEAKRDGYGPDKLDALVYLEQTVPGLAQALELWRRFELPDDLWTHALVKAGLDARYLPYLNKLKEGELLGLGDIAYGVVRGMLPAPSWVPVAPPASGDKVPRFPQVQIDPLTLAQKLGFNEDMLKLMVGRSGLSMAPVMAANALFRDIIGPNDYLLAIAEGDLRTEWADAVRDAARQILTAGEYAELQLRGFYDRTARIKNTRKHGMSDADSDLLYDVLGRGLAVHAVTTGLARGGAYGGTYADVPEPYRAAIQRSNIREEWAGLAYANRYNYPSAFVLRALTQGGEITGADAHQILLDVGWEPTLAAKVSAAWSGGTTSGADKHVGKAETQLWTALHRSYVAEESSDADVAPGLTAAGVPAASQAQVLALWGEERALIRKQLSPAQVKKAVAEGVTNPATGVAWSAADGLAALLARGYSQADATTLLEE